MLALTRRAGAQRLVEHARLRAGQFGMDGDGGIGVEQTAIGSPAVALAAELNRLASATAEWQTAKAAAVSSLPVPPPVYVAVLVWKKPAVKSLRCGCSQIAVEDFETAGRIRDRLAAAGGSPNDLTEVQCAPICGVVYTHSATQVATSAVGVCKSCTAQLVTRPVATHLVSLIPCSSALSLPLIFPSC